MSVEQLVTEALVPVAEAWKRGDKYSDGSPGSGAALRLDFETVEEGDVTDLICAMMINDIVDVIINGDISLSSDPLLKAMNGANKLNKIPVRVWIPRGNVYKQYKHHHKIWQYTAFVNLCVEWEDYTNNIIGTFADSKESISI